MNKTKQNVIKTTILLFGVIGILDLSGVIKYFGVHHITALWIIPIFILSVVLSISLTKNKTRKKSRQN